MPKLGILALAAAGLAAPVAVAAEEVVNLYSSRHYDVDEQMYAEFEEQTGIRVVRIEGDADELMARMQAEGRNSPADVFVTVDTSRLARAKSLGLLQSVDSAVLAEKIPANLRDVDNQWFGISQRSRIIFYDKADVANPPQTYLDLADPAYKGMVCARSSTNSYNQTLLAAVIENHGAEAALEWAKGVVANFAREPQGGDTDQLRGLVSGECEIAVSNTYYFARALRENVDGVTSDIDRIGWVWPSQDGEGAHMNLSGVGVAAYAPHRDNAVKFLEYLTSESAQVFFSTSNDEFPVVPGTPLAASVEKLGPFKADTVNLSAVAENLPEAQRIFNEAGWK